MYRFCSVATLVVALGIGATVQARSGNLWSERGQSSTPLAQVPNFRTLAARVVPAVVSIQVEHTVKSRRGEGDFFRWWGDVPREYHNRGIGTGFIISRDGLILTNNHVIEGAGTIEVAIAQDNGKERKLKATVVGAAPQYDVALLKTEQPVNAAICYLGDSDKTGIGDWVMAVGNPFGLSHSVSVGIISAKQRRGIVPSGRAGLYDFIQTDASINPGNSGGPLINMRGEVIGINTAINAAGSGIGFAIPINMVKAMIPELHSKGKFVRSWIGIRIQQLTDDLAQSYGRPDTSGALVAEVVPGSPAEAAKIKEGDIVLKFGGKTVSDNTDLPLFASMAGVGERIDLVIWRKGSQIHATVTLSAAPNQTVATAPKRTETDGELGIVVADITPQLQREYNLDPSRGVFIREVEPGSVAHQAGLRAGDVLVSLNGRAVRAAREFVRVVRKIRSGSTMRLQVRRPGGKLFVAVTKP